MEVAVATLCNLELSCNLFYVLLRILSTHYHDHHSTCRRFNQASPGCRHLVWIPGTFEARLGSDVDPAFLACLRIGMHSIADRCVIRQMQLWHQVYQRQNLLGCTS